LQTINTETKMSAETVRQLRLMGACEDGRKSTRPYSTMGEWWDDTDNIEWMFWLADKLCLVDGPAMRLFGVWCARQVQHLMTDQRSIYALDVAERYAAGGATRKELAAARDAALAARDAAWAARDAALAAARDAAWAAALDAARDAAWAAGDAAWAAARDAARDAGCAALAAARAAQRAKLREIFPASHINRLWEIKINER